MSYSVENFTFRVYGFVLHGVKGVVEMISGVLVCGFKVLISKVLYGGIQFPEVGSVCLGNFSRLLGRFAM